MKQRTGTTIPKMPPTALRFDADTTRLNKALEDFASFLRDNGYKVHAEIELGQPHSGGPYLLLSWQRFTSDEDRSRDFHLCTVDKQTREVRLLKNSDRRVRALAGKALSALYAEVSAQMRGLSTAVSLAADAAEDYVASLKTQHKTH